VSPRPPPISTALIGSLGGLLCLLVPCSGFNGFQHPQLALALGGLSLLFRSVFVINFLGFVVQLASISTKLPLGAYVGAIGFAKDGNFLHILFLPRTSPTWLLWTSLQSNSRPALQSAARLALQSEKRLVLNAIFFDYYFFPARSNSLQQLRFR
jgi:hypothetical protein